MHAQNEKALSQTGSSKPPRPLSSTRPGASRGSASGAPSQANIKRLLRGQGQEDPLAEEQIGVTSQTVMLGSAQHSDFLEEDANHYKLTRFKDAERTGSLRGDSGKRSFKNGSERALSDPEVRADPASDEAGTQKTTSQLAQLEADQNNYTFALVKSDIERRSARGQFLMSGEQQAVTASPLNGTQLMPHARVSSFAHEVAQAVGLNSDPNLKGVVVRQEVVSDSDTATQQLVAALPSGVNSDAQVEVSDGRSQVTQKTTLNRVNLGSNFCASDSEVTRTLTVIGNDERSGSSSQPPRSMTGGQNTAVVPSVGAASLQVHVPAETAACNQELDAQETLNAEVTAQILTGEAVQSVVTGNEHAMQTISSPMAQRHVGEEQESESEASHRRLLTGSHPIEKGAIPVQARSEVDHVAQASPPTVEEQVQSAEFAMSTFNILSNQEMDKVVVSSGNNQVPSANQKGSDPKPLQQDSALSQNAAERVSKVTTVIQKAHILSGTQELKQSSSVLTGGPQPDQETVLARNASPPRTASVNPSGANEKPNRPLKEHFDAIDIGKGVGQLVNEQVVYNRLPKNYFMEEAQEQIDVDIAINDIKQLRSGFVSYVNEQGEPAESPQADLDQFLDPQKFIERHFGAENPDIIFEEVITHVPEPIQQPEPQPKEEEWVQDEAPEMDQVEEAVETAPEAVPSRLAGGFSEQNVTPATDDLLLGFSERPMGPSAVGSILDSVKVPGRADSKCITGETFLKDAKLVDMSVRQAQEQQLHADQLERPFNENEFASMPQHKSTFTNQPGGVHSITLAMDSQEAFASAGTNAYESGNEKMRSLDKRGVGTQPYDNPYGHSGRIKIQTYDTKSADNTSQHRPLAPSDNPCISTMPKSTLGQPESEPKSREINVTKRRKQKDKFAPRQPLKVLHMASYFKPTPQSISALNMSADLMGDELTTLPGSNVAASIMDEQGEEELKARLEQDILDNVDVNFIFNKGRGLSQGLIDQDRIFSVMNKLKELAYKQLQSGSGQINYQEIVAYLRDSEGFFADEIKVKPQSFQVQVGATNFESLSADTANKTLATASIDQIANEPDLVGLEDNRGEKQRRWNQCVEFLRHNPKLLLQMIPDSDDEDAQVLKQAQPVGRVRPQKRSKVRPQRPQAPQKNSTTRPPVPPKFLAMSEDAVGGNAGRKRRAVNRASAAQRPIRINGNVVRRNAKFLSGKASKKSLLEAGPELQQEEDRFSDPVRIIEGEASVTDQVFETDPNQWQVDPQMLNIETSASQVDNPSSMALKLNQLPQRTPETTKASFLRTKEPLEERHHLVQGEAGLKVNQQSSLAMLKKRQQSAVTRPTTTYVVSTAPARSVYHSNTMTNSASADFKIRKSVPSKGFRTSYPVRNRINTTSAMQQEENSGTTSPAGGSFMFMAANRLGVLSQSRILPVQSVKSHSDLASITLQKRLVDGKGQIRNDRNSKTREFYGTANLRERNLMSAANQDALSDALLELGKDGRIKRPTTAVTGPSLTQAHGIGRRRLASNSILNFSSATRQSTRRFQYSKQNYQTSGTLRHVTSCVKATLQEQLTKQQNEAVLPVVLDGSRRKGVGMADCSLSQETLENRMTLNRNVQIDMQADVPSIFRQSKEMSAISANNADGQYFLSETGEAHPVGEVVSTAEIGLQTGVEQTAQKDADVQTEIQDVTMEISPGPKAAERSLHSHVSMALSKHVDWAYTPLCVAVLSKQVSFNQANEVRVFVQAEIEVVLQMVRSNFGELSQTEKMAPYHAKALATLRELIREQGLEELISRFERQYSVVTIENTLKLLLRCQLLFGARSLFISIFEKIVRYEAASQDAKVALQESESYKLPLRELNELRLKCGRMYEAGEKVNHEIRELRADRKGHYSQPFIFKNKDLTLRIRNEIAEVRQLMKVYRVQRRSDSEDSQKPTRFQVESEDEVSEREEVRDSNYVGTDLYWENRFYQVRPFKKAHDEETQEGARSEASVLKDFGAASATADEIADKEFTMV